MTDFVIAESAIRQLQARCVDAVWRKDSQAFADCFAEDGEWKLAGMHLHGRAEIKTAFEKLLGACERVFTLAGTPILELGQGTASARTYVLEHAKLVTGQTASTIGIYYERFVEQPTGWKFQWRHWTLHYRGPADLTAPFYNSPDYGLPPGMPGRDDPTTLRRDS
jgi:ketosteroid isomerase-like protein